VSFDGVSGHAAVLESLQERVQQGKCPHALLFTGPRGIGKRLIAKRLAEDLIQPEACNSTDIDEVLRDRIAGDQHPDVHLIAPEGKLNVIKIEVIRNLKSRVMMKPFEAKAQVVILDEAHTMNVDAQNAFLKILEEPPKHVYFILVSSDSEHLLQTVRSRCQRILFQMLSAEETTHILIETLGIAESTARELAILSQGSIEEAQKIQDEDFQGIVASLFQLLDFAKSGEVMRIPDWGNDRTVEMQGLDVLAQIFRDLFIWKITQGSKDRLFFQDHIDWYNRIEDRWTLEALDECIDHIGSARAAVQSSANTKLVMNNLMMQIGIRLI